MRWLIAVLAAGALACNAVMPTPTVTQSTPFPTAEAGRWVVMTEGSSLVQVVDTTGLVTNVIKAHITELDQDAAVVALPDQQMINVTWFGGACDLSTLWIEGDANQVVMNIATRQGAATPPGAECPAVGASHGVSLSVSQPVDQAAVSINVGQAH